MSAKADAVGDTMVDATSPQGWADYSGHLAIGSPSSTLLQRRKPDKAMKDENFALSTSLRHVLDTGTFWQRISLG